MSIDVSLRATLARCKTIAMIGASERVDRDSNHVMAYLLANKFAVIPIAPGVKSILGQTCYASLKEVPAEVRAHIDLVDVFRRADALPGVWADVKQYVPSVKCVWLQKGLTHEAARAEAAALNIELVENKCIMVEHRALFSVPKSML